MTRTASSLTKAPGSGCCGHCGGSCSCGGGHAREGATRRPRFFAGQLLTQEDLALIVDYTVGKARLRNRLLFGEGVVCGLTVTCPPCGDGTVIVSPGYALDCCGNDIHLPCQVELNINRLVRELRLRQLDGWDCGDPCETKLCNEDRNAGRGNAEEQPRRKAAPTHRYCLYIRYHEVEAEPVAPYVTDADCGQIPCEATRIVETYEFELRCGGEKRKPADLFTAFAACLGDLRSAAEMTERAQAGQAKAEQVLERTAWLRTSPAGSFAQQDEDALADAMKDVVRFQELEAAGASPPEEAEFRRMLASLEVAAAAIARLRSLDDNGRKDALGRLARRGQLQASLRRAPELLKHARAAVTRLSGELLKDAPSRDAALDLAELAERYAANPFEAAPASDELQLLRSGMATGNRQLARLRVDAAQLRNFLAERLSRSARLTSCDLLDRLHRVRLGDGEGITIDDAERVSKTVEELAAILLEHMRDCLCLALNPACAPPCDDPAVLLASLELRDCEVIEICNMSRRFVLSPAALRYWLPPLGMLGTLLERACCELDIRSSRPRQTVPGRLKLVQAESQFHRTHMAQPEPEGPVAQTFVAAGVEPETVARFASLLGNLGALAQRNVSGVEDVTGRLGDILLRPVEAARVAMRGMARDEATEARKAAVREAGARAGGDLEKLAEEVRSRAAAEVHRAFEAELAPERLAERIRTTATVTELRELNARLRQDVERLAGVAQEDVRKLTEQLDDLRKRVERQPDNPRPSNRQPKP
jgi:hypothetical protein